MLIGVVLAARNVARRFLGAHDSRLCPIAYLRADIWDALRFSDKNKVSQTFMHELSWNSGSLATLIELRASNRLSRPVKFGDLEDGAVLRRNETKWSHIVARTSLRPRDAIQFMNCALSALKARTNGPTVLTNEDIRTARESYSTYYKQELDDEVPPHWPDWEVAMQAIAANQNVNFSLKDFAEQYEKRSGSQSANSALEKLFDFSIIGYKTPKSGGGSRWVFRHLEPHASWDPGAGFFKVHPGLKEYYKLKDDRGSRGARALASVGAAAGALSSDEDDGGDEDVGDLDGQA